MPTIAGCNICEWSPETDEQQPFNSNMEAKGYAIEHAKETGHRGEVWIEDVPET